MNKETARKVDAMTAEANRILAHSIDVVGKTNPAKSAAYTAGSSPACWPRFL
jgi:hypothetical protein